MRDARVHPLDNVGVFHATVNVEREERAPNHKAELIAKRGLAASGLACDMQIHGRADTQTCTNFREYIQQRRAHFVDETKKVQFQ